MVETFLGINVEDILSVKHKALKEGVDFKELVEKFDELKKENKKLKKEYIKLKEFADYSINNRNELTRQINFWIDRLTQSEQENQQLKELLKLCKENIENYRNGKNYYFTSDNIIRLIDNIENTIQTNNDDARKVNLEAVSKMETTTQTNSGDTKPINDWNDFVVAVGASITSTCIYAPKKGNVYGEPEISFDDDGSVWASGNHGSVRLFKECPPALMYEMYMQRLNEVDKW